MPQTSRALHQNLTSTKGGDIRQTPKEYVLLLQCSASGNEKHRAFLRLYRTFSQSKQGFYPTLFLLCEKASHPRKRAAEVNKDVYPLCAGNVIAAP